MILGTFVKTNFNSTTFNMKSKTVKLLIIIGLLPLLCFSQENNFRIHSISAGLGYIDFTSKEINSSGGLNFVADFTTNYNENLISVYFNIGGAVDILSTEDGEASEINITYGREWDLSDHMKFEAHAGIGYFKWGYASASTNYLLENETTVGFPVRAKLIYYFGEHFGVGLNPNINFNSLAISYSADFILQYKF